jgi:uncharacterized circularly permuted ATP-grasp superfamily protein/uncharacterized alpha-E superfamily protein
VTATQPVKHAEPEQAALPLGPGAGAGLGLALLRRVGPAVADAYDELRDPQGRLRPAWARILGWLPSPADGVGGAAALDRMRVQVVDRLRQDGVTHNVFSADGVAARPWSLELLPMLIDAADWAQLERGLAQRAHLLQALLDDVYGEQRVLKEGLLPPALVLRHPGYLRPLQGVQAPGGQRLFIVAFDLARAADGQWWVVSQRTQVPSGLGYVMHNRLIVSQQFPEAFRELRVQHLAGGYRRLLDTIEARASAIAGAEPARIVLLTPGRYSETYFEHAYLARYLGLPLVEGSDLTVVGETLYLKTVEGLQPVHGVMRRLDDDFCDPLELRPDSALGVPGLLQVARAGRVVLANALGSAFLESPALMGFLPGIAEQLLGQKLALPAVATWWCGEPAAWTDVQRQLQGKLLRTTFPNGGRTSMVHPFDQRLVEADPDAWTLQNRMNFSRAPIWASGVVRSRPTLVRMYAICDEAGRWHVLPGGMTRASASEDGSLSMQRGGSSLDTWVLTEGAVDAYTMLPQRLTAAQIAQRRIVVSSRTGESLFWMGRYSERAEQLTRLARVILQVIDADSEVDAASLQALTALAVHSGLVPAGVPSLARSQHLFLRAMIGAMRDASGAFSLAYTLQALDRNVQSLRERLSVDQAGLFRRMLEDFSAAMDDSSAFPSLSQLRPALDRLVLQLAAATGAQTDRMTRDHGWRLLTVGRLLERLMAVTGRLERFAATRALCAAGGVDLLLELFDSAITFRARYQRHDDLLALTEMLVDDDTIPRAVAGVLRRLRTEWRKLPGDAAWREEQLGLLPRVGSGLTLESLDGLDDQALLQQLATHCRHLALRASDMAEAVEHRYFTMPGGADQAQRV